MPKPEKKPQAVQNLEARQTEGVRSPEGRDPRSTVDEGVAGKSPSSEAYQAGESGDRQAGGSGKGKVEAWAKQNETNAAGWMNNLDDPKGFTPKANAPAELAPETEQPAATGDEAPPRGEASEPEADGIDQAQYNNAVLGLKFAHMPIEQIANLDVATVLAMGLPLREKQKQDDARLQDESRGIAPDQETSVEEDGSEKPSSPPQPLQATLQNLNSELETLGADPDVLAKFGTDLTAALNAMVTQQAAPQSEGLQQRELERLVMNDARASLTDTFEQLSDLANWNAVKGDVLELAEAHGLEAFGGVQGAVEYAAFTRFGAESLGQIRQAKTARSARRRPPTPIDSHHRAAPLTMDQWSSKMASASVAGNRAEVERLEGLKPVQGMGRHG